MTVTPRLLGSTLSLAIFSLVLSGCGSSNSDPVFSVVEASVVDIQQAILEKRTTCTAVVEQYLQRIALYDLEVDQSPPINSFVVLNVNARDQARSLDQHFAEHGALLGPLHCAVVVLKDNFDSFDSPTSAGTLALLGSQPPDDGFAVARIRAAGGVILGKTTQDEFAVGIVGKSTRSGRTGNIYDTRVSPGGSSGGSATAVGANFATVSTGADNCGSNRIPPAYANIFGIRSSYGLISQEGTVPTGNVDAIEGPMARTMHDLALMMDAMAAVDPLDPKTQDPQRQQPESFVDHLREDGLQGRRIGVLRSVAGRDQFAGASDNVNALYDAFLGELEAGGATVVPDVRLPDFNDQRQPESLSGRGVDMNAYLASFPSVHPDMASLCASGRWRALGTGPGNLGYELACRAVYDSVYEDQASAEAKFEANRQYVEGIMDELELDALVYPVDPVGVPRENNNTANCLVSSVSGLPSLVVPAGFANTRVDPVDDDDKPLPVGMQFLGRKWDEATLFEIASGYALNYPKREPPKLVPATVPGPMDIAAANAVRLRIAEAAFEKITGPGGNAALTPENFTEVVREVLTTTD